MKQRNEKWYRDRAGRVTASRFKDILVSHHTGKPLKARKDYLLEIVTERLIGEPIIKTAGRQGEWGKSVEPYAIAAYEARTGTIVMESEFCKHPMIKMVGCSPDGLISNKGGVEVKCPANPTIHILTFIHGMPDEHKAQVQGGMWVTGRSWWDFISYDPRMPDHLKLYIQRIKRDKKFIEGLEKDVRKFLLEVKKFQSKLPKAVCMRVGVLN